ncbi:TIGR04282 family arsenosugar biosynthesis glycosyltransferase [Marinirhabdus gelatinilytica]|uniref:TIGR04282 family arsenosugar biosynthesis glycosyltransferase n=1 Tax=Marinirhabdus gelatinilytica TaxID=1703343 RepID=UPI001FE5A9A4|nr:TIGR04282 family arsenosugar biosynthesis glycosyltransferase [Marinirhabdus gelatinilytica]
MKTKNALIIFTRNPELGKCKTRLAVTIGDKSALDIYKFLLQHTAKVSANVTADRFVFYSEKVRENDLWEEAVFNKKVQNGDDLGIRMQHAFTEIFEMGYENAIIIGSDLYDITSEDINKAFSKLNTHDFVLGPAKDGGYYLLGMKMVKEEIFSAKNWGTDTVLKATLEDLKEESVAQLDEKNDIDYFADIKDVEAFQQFLPAHLDNKFI